MRRFFIKRTTGSDYLLLFFVSGAISVLGTRFYLYLLNYPQIATGNLHLAHALFGGILLTVSNLMLFTLQGKRLRQSAAVVGGFGFGLFIDEIGKYMTKNNDYFYQPVPMIIYLVFILLFFVYRYFDKETPLTAKERIYELLEHLEDIAELKFYSKTKKTIEKNLREIVRSTEHGYKEFAEGVQHFLESFPLLPHKQPKYVQRLHSSWQWLDELTTERKPIFYFLLILFLVYILNTFFSTASFIQIVAKRQLEEWVVQRGIDTRFEWFLIIAQLSSQLLAALFMVNGFVQLVRRHRLRALELFKNGLALTILISHVFTFYFKQFGAAPEVILTLVMFAIVYNMLEDEREEA